MIRMIDTKHFCNLDEIFEEDEIALIISTYDQSFLLLKQSFLKDCEDMNIITNLCGENLSENWGLKDKIYFYDIVGNELILKTQDRVDKFRQRTIPSNGEKYIRDNLSITKQVIQDRKYAIIKIESI